MYKNDFDKKLKANKIYKSYMFYGQSIFLVEEYSDFMAKKIAKDNYVEKIYFEDFNFIKVKDLLLQSSLFSSVNMIILKLNKKVPKKEIDSLIKACNSNPNSYIIFSCLGDADFKVMEKSFSEEKNGVSVRFFNPNESEAIQILQKKAKIKNINFDIEALRHLYFMHKNNLQQCVGDLDKLLLLDEKISISLINKYCFSMSNISFEDFLFELFSKKEVNSDFQILLDQGNNEIFLLSQIISYVQQLFMISSYARTIGTPNPKEILGYIPPRDIWNKKTKLAINIKPETFKEVLSYLLKIELDLKTSKVKNLDLYLNSALRKITALIR